MAERATRKDRAAALFPYTSLRQRDQLRRSAGDAVKRAVRLGLLIACPCVVCGSDTTEAHHDDYRKPLDVIWLCRQHHRERDAQIRSGAAHLPKHAHGKAPRLPRKRSYVKHAPLEQALPLVQETTRALVAAMDADGVSDTELAARIGTSRQYVGTLISGGIRTMKMAVAIASALGYDVRITLHRRDSETEAA